MIGENLARALEAAESHEEPVLSLYLDVNPANPDNQGNSVKLRTAETLRGIGLDKAYIDAVTKQLTKHHGRAQGRSLVVFAGEDPSEFFEAHYLQTRLPMLDRSDLALAHWGAPFTAPLHFVLDQKERYAVVSVSQDRVRVFEAFLGQIAEVAEFEWDAETYDWAQKREAMSSPATGRSVSARGGAATDRFRDKMRESTARLFRGLMPDLEKALSEAGVDRIILSGTPEPLAAFRAEMGNGLEKRLAGEMPPPSDPDGDASGWLPHASELIAEIENQHELALLDEVRERGVTGFAETLSLLQDHRLQTVIAPWALDRSVYRAADGRVAVSREEAAVLSPDQEVEEVPLLKALPGMVEQSGAELEFVEGEAERRLTEELGGLAGITRY